VTILSPESLTAILDVISSGASTVEASAAIGAAPKSKIVFSWLADSADSGEFDASPDPESTWAFEWNGKLDWFHLHYRDAQEQGRVTRSLRTTPMRAELEQRLAAKRQAKISRTSENIPPAPPPHYTLPLVVDHAKVDPVMVEKPRPPTRPSYAFRRAPPLDVVNDQNGPPSEGRFTMATQRISKAERQAGLPSVTDEGIKWH
jgi:hypothetical protein